MKKFILACCLGLAVLPLWAQTRGNIASDFANAFVSKEVKNAVLKAARNNDFAALKKAVNGANSSSMAVNVKNETGKTPLMLACYNGNLEMAKYLVKQGAKINTTDDEGRPAIYFAFLTRNDETKHALVRWLFHDMNAHVLSKAQFLIQNALMERMPYVALGMIYQAEGGEGLYVLSDKAYTPILLWAVKAAYYAKSRIEMDGYLAVIEHVLDKGADINDPKNREELWKNAAYKSQIYLYLTSRPEISSATALREFERMLQFEGHETLKTSLVDNFIQNHPDHSTFLRQARFMARDAEDDFMQQHLATKS